MENSRKWGICCANHTHMACAGDGQHEHTFMPPPPALILIVSCKNWPHFVPPYSVEERPRRMNIHIKAETAEEEKDQE